MRDKRDEEGLAGEFGPLERVEFYGGPMDGEFVDVDLDDPDPWVAIITPGCAHPGGRSMYAPDGTGRWVWVQDLPPEAI